jgi:hypothetical protein
VDSKAEKNALNNARVQVTQTSLEVRQHRQIRRSPFRASSRLSGIRMPAFLTTTVFVK